MSGRASLTTICPGSGSEGDTGDIDDTAAEQDVEQTGQFPAVGEGIGPAGSHYPEWDQPSWVPLPEWGPQLGPIIPAGKSPGMLP